MAGLTGETALGYIVRIRSEKDPNKIKEFTAKEKQIRSEWFNFVAKQKAAPQITMTIEQLQQALKSLAGG